MHNKHFVVVLATGEEMALEIVRTLAAQEYDHNIEICGLVGEDNSRLVFTDARFFIEEGVTLADINAQIRDTAFGKPEFSDDGFAVISALEQGKIKYQELDQQQLMDLYDYTENRIAQLRAIKSGADKIDFIRDQTFRYEAQTWEDEGVTYIMNEDEDIVEQFLDTHPDHKGKPVRYYVAVCDVYSA